jgi:hypothetical protein
MKEYEVVVENTLERNVPQLIRETVEELVYYSAISNSSVYVVRTSYIERLYAILNQTGLTYVIDEMSDDER